jgi:hypothetical protein
MSRIIKSDDSGFEVRHYEGSLGRFELVSLRSGELWARHNDEDICLGRVAKEAPDCVVVALVERVVPRQLQIIEARRKRLTRERYDRIHGTGAFAPGRAMMAERLTMALA